MKKVWFWLLYFFLFQTLKCEFERKIPNDLHQNFINCCMDIWTRIDLVRAINANHEQKDDFLDDIFILLIMSYNQFKKIKDCIITQDDEIVIKDISELIVLIEKSFKEVFSKIKTGSYLGIIYLIKRMKKELKIPSHLQSNIPS